MKTTIKNLILSAVLVVGGASCVDLDTAPYDRETDLTYWEEDPEAAVKALNTCYTYLGNMDEQLYCEAMTDMLIPSNLMILHKILVMVHILQQTLT